MARKNKRILGLFWILTITFFCGREGEIRSYREKSAGEAPETKTASPRPIPSVLQWKKPESWIEEKTGGMRLAAFSISSNNRIGHCTIIPLKGEAGGVADNVSRWLDQLGLPPFSEKEMDDFLGRQQRLTTEGGFAFILIDFTAISSSGSKADQSMLVAIVSVGPDRIFVKMTGERRLLIQNRESFLALCQSFKMG